MSAAHKDALAQGRNEGRAVRRYLEALDDHRPKRGRRRTVETIEAQLKTVAGRLGDAAPMERLLLLQKRADLIAELETFDDGTDFAAAEDDFVDHAQSYGERKGITYSTWRDAGVPAAVLRRAGVARD